MKIFKSFKTNLCTNSLQMSYRVFWIRSLIVTFRIELVFFFIWFTPARNSPFERAPIKAKTDGYASFSASLRRVRNCRTMDAVETDTERNISQAWSLFQSRKRTKHWKIAWGNSKHQKISLIKTWKLLILFVLPEEKMSVEVRRDRLLEKSFLQ